MQWVCAPLAGLKKVLGGECTCHLNKLRSHRLWPTKWLTDWLVCAPKLLVMSNVINFFQPFEYLYICHHPMVDSLSTSTLSVGPFCLWQCLLHFCHLRPSLYMAIPPTLCKGWSGTLHCSAGEKHHKWWIAGEEHHQWWSWSLQALWAPLALAPFLLALCFQNCKSMLKHMLV